ncbi:helix-turn-helix domain-containing protein [Rhodoplanes sp. Z2-YC6860]|uniref:helix-turn-helix domain-containing protein n=1 Tax=Rhodoplanes sp. Z2-YC6860 TaxID=674703 RepID=UPI00078C8E09|nr:helix-turn-helix transcriptional regulator [Rhodoplanes sp. Z2-YC6860]AMN40178.1 transcriptional regulator, XRE family [Rhodoplanes sp. Z2-YC6860]
MPKYKRTKHALAIDHHVGARIHMQRVALNMSQSALAEQLGLTFQQIQKYEKGANRVGAGRLQEIANIFEVPVSFFFEGAPQSPQAKLKLPANDAASVNMIDTFLASADGQQLVEAFVAIKSVKLRRSVVQLAEQIAKGT